MEKASHGIRTTGHPGSQNFRSGLQLRKKNGFPVDYRTLDQLRKANPAWRLLVADNAPMIVSFLHKTFIQPNVRTMAQPELASRLADYLYGLREKLGEEAFPGEPNNTSTIGRQTAGDGCANTILRAAMRRTTI